LTRRRLGADVGAAGAPVLQQDSLRLGVEPGKRAGAVRGHARLGP